MKLFVAFLFLVMCSVCGAAEQPFCSWDHPGLNKYQKNPVEALNDYYMDFTVRAQLRAKMELHQYDDIVEIRRDGVFGNGVYSNLRDMHYGKGSYCPGVVDTGHWAASEVQRGLVYCVNENCVVVPTVCNNVSLIDRKAEAGPIDIAPEAGPSPGASQPGLNQGSGEPGPVPGNAADQDFPATGPSTSYSEGPGYGLPGFVVPGYPGSPPGPGGFVGPIRPSPGGFVGPIRPVPETPEWIMILAGVVCFFWLWNRRDKRRD